MNEFVIMRDSECLEHHGIKGQKWGVRRYQNKDGSYTKAGSARYYKNSLNKSDQEFANASAKYMRAMYKVDKASSKSASLYSKAKDYSSSGNTKAAHKTLQKIQKQTNRIDKYSQKAKSAQSLMDAAESKTWKLIGEVSANGYTVNSSKVIRNGERGKTYVAAALAGISGVNAKMAGDKAQFRDTYRTEWANGIYIDQNPSNIVGNKYTVSR